MQWENAGDFFSVWEEILGVFLFMEIKFLRRVRIFCRMPPNIYDRIYASCAWDKPCRRHVRKVQIAACGGFAAFAGGWGVPSQRFRISQKDILKHCWQRVIGMC